MRIVFFTSYSVSHIIPIKGLIRYLKDNNFDIVCFVHSKNVAYCIENDIPYIEYPNNYWNKKHYKEAKEKSKKVKKYEEKKDFIKTYNAFLEEDAIGIYNYYDDVAKYIENLIDNFQPDIVFRDSTDIYWMKLKKKEKYLHIKTIGYITNNLYSWDFLLNSYDYILPVFLGIIHFLPIIPNDYLIDFKNNIENIYKNISIELKEDYIRPFYQYDPKEKLNIVFSQKILQPHYNNRNDIIILPPSISDFKIENNISTDIQEYCKSDNLIYISTGSFMSREIDYYKEILTVINNKLDKFKIIISGGKATDKIQSLIDNMNLKNDVLVKKKIPQLYVLKHSYLFITSGGMNSIKEAIYYKIPMIIFPISSEQRLNGLIVEKLKIGISTYKIPSPFEYLDTKLDRILIGNLKNNYTNLKCDYDSTSILKEIFLRLGTNVI